MTHMDRCSYSRWRPTHVIVMICCILWICGCKESHTLNDCCKRGAWNWRSKHLLKLRNTTTVTLLDKENHRKRIMFMNWRITAVNFINECITNINGFEVVSYVHAIAFSVGEWHRNCTKACHLCVRRVSVSGKGELWDGVFLFLWLPWNPLHTHFTFKDIWC